MKTAAVIFALLVLWGFVSEGAYQDELRAERTYCAMVLAGDWPAYRDDIECPEIELAEIGRHR